MSTDSDLIKLYSQRILALAADIPHRGRLEAPQASVRKARAALRLHGACGSRRDRRADQPLRHRT
jgi:hypothetical protein